MESVHPFKFNCSPGVSCFTRCCGDITIVLTPYDVLRIKSGLKISSAESHDKYTIIIPKEGLLNINNPKIQKMTIISLYNISITFGILFLKAPL